MTLNALHYRKNPETIEAVELTRDNLVAVATWCGGRLENIQNVMSDKISASSIGVPSLYGAISADIGTFVVRIQETGAFSVMTREHLDKEYQRFGLRQDGIRPGSTNNWNGQR